MPTQLPSTVLHFPSFFVICTKVLLHPLVCPFCIYEKIHHFLATNERVGILSCFWQLRELVTIVGRTSGRNLDGVFVGDPFPEAFFAVWITEPCCFQEEDELDICDGVALSRSLPPLSSTWVELDASAALSVTPWSPAFLCVARFLWNSLSQENSNIIDFDGTFTSITDTLVDCNALTSSEGPLGV